MNSLETMRLGHRFGRRVLFRKMALRVDGGDVLAVTGANGSGKSTLLKILAGVLRSTAGTVTLHVDGKRVPREDHPLRVGCISPYVNLYDDLTARENLEFVARVRGLSQADGEISKVLETVRLAPRAHERVYTFSSGMKQRIKIAVAILPSPPVLILDEPSANLDSHGQALCANVVADAKARGSVVVIASNVAEDYSGADTVICVEDYAC